MIAVCLSVQLSAHAATNYMNWYGSYSLDQNNEIKVKLASSLSFNNSPYNFKNSPYNFNRNNGIYDNKGNSWGYHNNGNIFDNKGNRKGYFGN